MRVVADVRSLDLLAAKGFFKSNLRWRDRSEKGRHAKSHS